MVPTVLLPAILIIIGLALSFFNLYAGLFILVLFGPFFTLLHEMSPGSSIYFLWPFALCGVMVLSIVYRELSGWRNVASERGRMVRLLWGAIVIAALMLTAMWTVNGLESVFLDVEMKDFSNLLINRNMAFLGALMSITILVFLGVYFREMKRREERYCILDLTVAGLLTYGMFQLAYTALFSKLVFLGLDGFRYYFFMLIVYFLARYVIRSRQEVERLLLAVGVVCIIGAAQLLAEGYLLNVYQVAPTEMPWVGHLARNWGYLPEGGRSFFEGDYRPMGLMYMTHMSGLFLLLGIALWIPRLFGATSGKQVVWYLAPLLFVLLSVIWTSRTVLVLLACIYVLAAVLMRASWVRALSGGFALALFCVISSYHFLPGFWYDVVEDVKFIALRGLPATMRAVEYDWLTLLGKEKKVEKQMQDGSPPEWRLLMDWRTKYARASVIRVQNERIVGNYGLAIQSGVGSKVMLRRVLKDTRKLRRKEVIVGAWLKAEAPRLLRLSVEDYASTVKSRYHSGSGKWEFVKVRHRVDPLSEIINVNIDVEHTDQTVDTAFVDGVYLAALGKVITLMSHPSGFPLELFRELRTASDVIHGQSMSLGEIGTERIQLETKLFEKREASLQKMHHFVFGRGMSFGPWSSLFFPKERAVPTAFTTVSYSDFKYLEFFEQFGAVGLILFLSMGVLSLKRGFSASWRDQDPQSRATRVGLTLIVFIGFAAMFHLPSLFKTGVNTTVYMAMAVLIRESTGHA